MSRTVYISAAQYPLDFFLSAPEYKNKLHDWVKEAASEGAQLLVFPEYGAMELASLAGEKAAADLTTSIDAVSERLELQASVHEELALKFNVAIIAASGPQRHPDGKVTNVARIFGPTGKQDEYHKLMPTPWERNSWGISPGPKDGLKVFDLGFAKVGLVICYDMEFPLISRALAESGADVILAPSNTETEHGFWRVRTGCMARALENQLYTVHAPTVGNVEWCPAVDINIGAAGIFAPSDQGFPPGGVLVMGEMNRPQWVYAKLDLNVTKGLRENGGVQTYQHWQEQPGAGNLPPAQVISLI